jgi:hypothetical protein
MGTAPTSGVVTITSSVVKNAFAWSIVEFSGVNTSGTNGSGAVTQIITAIGNSSSPTVTLGAFSNTNNVTYAATGVSSSTATVTPGSGYTELHDQTEPTTNWSHIETEWIESNDTSVTSTLSASALWGILGIEIAQAGIACSEPVAEIASTTNATTYAFGAFTPADNATLVMLVFADGTDATGSVTGGLTWTLEDSQVYNTADKAYLFWANTGTSPGSLTFSFDCTGNAATGCCAALFQFTGSDVARANPIKQKKKAATTAANPTITFDAAMDTANGYCAGFGMPRNAPTSTAPTNWIEVADTGHNSPAAGFSAAFRTQGETGSTVTFTSASAAYGIIAAEIYATAASSLPPLLQRFDAMRTLIRM